MVDVNCNIVCMMIAFMVGKVVSHKRDVSHNTFSTNASRITIGKLSFIIIHVIEAMGSP